MRVLLAIALLALLPAPAAAQEPFVTTGPAQGIGATSATLTGTVAFDEPGATFHFEYGTTTEYGLETPAQPVGDGNGPVDVAAAVQGLSAATTYHYRLVAEGVTGDDRTFATAKGAAPPGISGLRVLDKSTSSAHVTARIDPNRGATVWYVEWGTSPSFGRRTPDATLPEGNGDVAVTAALDGLPSYRRIYWRVVATNAAGIKRSGRSSFVTLRSPRGVTLRIEPAATTWGRTVDLDGRMSGTGVSGLTVALQQSTFPFTAGYQVIATERTNRAGAFSFDPLPVSIATRFRAVVLSMTSREVAVRVRSRVRIRRTHRTRRSLRLTGHSRPGLPAGEARLQRQRRLGGWKTVAKQPLTPRDALRSDYEFKVRRARRALRYRVVIAAHDGGAHARGYSRALVVDPRRPR